MSRNLPQELIQMIGEQVDDPTTLTRMRRLSRGLYTGLEQTAANMRQNEIDRGIYRDKGQLQLIPGWSDLKKFHIKLQKLLREPGGPEPIVDFILQKLPAIHRWSIHPDIVIIVACLCDVTSLDTLYSEYFLQFTYAIQQATRTKLLPSPEPDDQYETYAEPEPDVNDDEYDPSVHTALLQFKYYDTFLSNQDPSVHPMLVQFWTALRTYLYAELENPYESDVTPPRHEYSPHRGYGFSSRKSVHIWLKAKEDKARRSLTIISMIRSWAKVYPRMWNNQSWKDVIPPNALYVP